MNARDAILARVRAALSGGPPVDLPEPIEVWPRLRPPALALAERFTDELQAVHGETLRVASINEARCKLEQIAQQDGWKELAVMDRPLCRELVAGLPSPELRFPQSDWHPARMAELSAAVITPECLLADTGSALVACGTPQERMLCYLPPSCVIVARMGQLVEHLPAAWEEIAPRAADPSLRGEFVIITGPSRTADIEKILILGVHGPKRLVVLLVD